MDVGRDPTTGKRKQVTESGFRTRRDAEQWNREQLGRPDRGEFVTPSKVTYGAFLAEWLPAIRYTIRPSTWESSERLCRRHLIPRLAHVPLQQLYPST